MTFQPANPEFETVVRSSFARQSMMHMLGATLEDISPGACTIRSSIPDHARQQHGFGHAGLTFSIGDSAAGYAALSLMDADHEVVTAEMKISLMAPARGDHLLALGKVLRPGRRLVTVQADVYAVDQGQKTHIAVLLGSMVPVTQR